MMGASQSPTAVRLAARLEPFGRGMRTKLGERVLGVLRDMEGVEKVAVLRVVK